MRRTPCVTTASAVPAAGVMDGTAPAATICVATAPTEPVAVVMRPRLRMSRRMAQCLERRDTRHDTRSAVATERRVVATARTWREGLRRKRKVRRRKTVARRAPDIVRSWRRSCHGSRRGSAGGGAGGVGAGGLSTVVHGADRTAVRGALEGRGEVVVAAANVISAAETTVSAETK